MRRMELHGQRNRVAFLLWVLQHPPFKNDFGMSHNETLRKEGYIWRCSPRIIMGAETPTDNVSIN